MFTLQQIKDAHSKVKSGADFPAYIRDLKAIGVESYDTFVADGHSEYFGKNGYKIVSEAKYDVLSIAEKPDLAQFKSDLKNHQQGKTDYPTFCDDCANCGVEKWTVSLHGMTCTYFDKSNNEFLEEQIPQ